MLATTVRPEEGTDTEILQAYQDQNTTVEPGFRWIKNPTAIAPVWIEKPERIAALAMLTVVGLLVYSIIPGKRPGIQHGKPFGPQPHGLAVDLIAVFAVREDLAALHFQGVVRLGVFDEDPL